MQGAVPPARQPVSPPHPVPHPSGNRYSYRIVYEDIGVWGLRPHAGVLPLHPVQISERIAVYKLKVWQIE
jgi:hypothetical protein